MEWGRTDGVAENQAGALRLPRAGGLLLPTGVGPVSTHTMVVFEKQ